MGIRYREQERAFHLQGPHTSYIIQLNQKGVPMHAYWGRKIREENLQGLLVYTERSPFM